MGDDIEIKCFALGTLNLIKIYGCTERTDIVNCIASRLGEIDDHMSAFKETSDVSKIVAAAGKSFVEINQDTMSVLKKALWYHHVSHGAFDITIRPLVELWGIGKKNSFIPDQKAIEEAKSKLCASSVILKEDLMQAKLDTVQGAIDLGGIAKGYAADEIKKIILEHNISSGIINLGGNVVVIGNKPDRSPWKIGIQNPLEVRGEYVGVLKVCNKTIVTSGTNEQFFIKDKKRYHHLLDPATGYPADTGLLSVTAVCDQSIDADAMTTALFVLGLEKGMELLKEVGADAIFIKENGEINITEGLKDQFEIISSSHNDRRKFNVS